MAITLGVIIALLIVIACLLWDTARALNRLEGVLPAARKWLDEVERKESVKRMEARHAEEIHWRGDASQRYTRQF
jgi:hypothetical protein